MDPEDPGVLYPKEIIQQESTVNTKFVLNLKLANLHGLSGH